MIYCLFVISAPTTLVSSPFSNKAMLVGKRNNLTFFLQFISVNMVAMSKHISSNIILRGRGELQIEDKVVVNV